MNRYKDAGVDVAAGEAAVKKFAKSVEATFTPEVMTQVGGFGSLFDISNLHMSNPTLVSSTDGVGTKTQLARLLHKHDSIGQDLVAMCVDDIACLGARPLFFLDYIAVGHQDPDTVSTLVEGIAQGCKIARCALVGGETAEHPGVMEKDDFDLAGFVVGVVDRDNIWGAYRVQDGDVLVGLESPNLRSNGFSLVRKIYQHLFESNPSHLDRSSQAWLEQLLQPSILYSPHILGLSNADSVHAAAHITGGGIANNLERSLPNHLRAKIRLSSWTRPTMFEKIQRDGSLDDDDMLQTFNMGIGMILLVSKTSSRQIMDQLDESGVPNWEIGYVERADTEMERVTWIG